MPTEPQTVLEDTDDALHDVIDDIAGEEEGGPEPSPAAEPAAKPAGEKPAEEPAAPAEELEEEPSEPPAKEEPAEPPSKEKPAVEPEVPEEEPPKEEPPEEVAPTEEPAAEEPPAEVHLPEPQPEITLEEYNKQMADFREKALPELEKTYAVSAEDVDEFQTNPGEVLSRLASQLHFNIYTSLYSAVISQLPGVMNQVNSASQQSNELETAFYAKWGKLKDPSHKAVVDRTVRAYRQLNPKADADTFINEAGLLAMSAAGLPLEVDVQPVGGEETPPAAKKKGVKPAAPGSGGTPRKAGSKKGTGSVFEEIAEDVSGEDFYG